MKKLGFKVACAWLLLLWLVNSILAFATQPTEFRVGIIYYPEYPYSDLDIELSLFRDHNINLTVGPELWDTFQAIGSWKRKFASYGLKKPTNIDWPFYDANGHPTYYGGTIFFPTYQLTTYHGAPLFPNDNVPCKYSDFDWQDKLKVWGIYFLTSLKRECPELWACNIIDEDGYWDDAGKPFLTCYCPGCQQRFREFLQAKNYQPSDFGFGSWAEVSPPKPAVAKTQPKFWREWVMSRSEWVMRLIKLKSEAVKTVPPVKTTGFFTPGCVEGWSNLLAHGADWWQVGKHGYLDIMTADPYPYGSPYCFHPQWISYVCDLLRSANKYNSGKQIGLVLQHYGGQPASGRPIEVYLKPMAYSGIAHESKFLLYYPGWSKTHGETESLEVQPERFQKIKEVSSEIVQVENVLYPGRIEQPQVAILFPYSTFLYQVSNNYLELERIGVYLALLHSHIPVDFLTEDDIQQGYLENRGYKVLYLAGASHIEEGTARKIEAWVAGGGYLWASAGAGIYNQFNQPQNFLNEIFGLTGSTFELVSADSLWFKWSPKPQSAGVIKFKAQETQGSQKIVDFLGCPEMNIYGYRQRFTLASQVEVQGRYEDDSPAVISRNYGRGKALLFGNLPGLAYLENIATPCANEVFIEVFDNQVRVRISQITSDAGVSIPVKLTEPLIEATLLKSASGIIIPLINYTFLPVEDLKLEIAYSGNISAIRSMRLGALKYRRSGGVVSVTLPQIGDTDFITIEF